MCKRTRARAREGGADLRERSRRQMWGSPTSPRRMMNGPLLRDIRSSLRRIVERAFTFRHWSLLATLMLQATSTAEGERYGVGGVTGSKKQQGARWLWLVHEVAVPARREKAELVKKGSNILGPTRCESHDALVRMALPEHVGGL